MTDSKLSCDKHYLNMLLFFFHIREFVTVLPTYLYFTALFEGLLALCKIQFFLHYGQET